MASSYRSITQGMQPVPQQSCGSGFGGGSGLSSGSLIGASARSVRFLEGFLALLANGRREHKNEQEYRYREQ